MEFRAPRLFLNVMGELLRCSFVEFLKQQVLHLKEIRDFASAIMAAAITRLMTAVLPI